MSTSAEQGEDLTDTVVGDLLGAPLAEAAVLGALLRTTAEHARTVLSTLTADDWTVPQHAHVAIAMQALLDADQPVDPISVLGQLRRQGLESASTASRNAGVLLLDLYAAAPCVSHAAHYSRIVQEHSYRRRVQTAAQRLLQVAASGVLDDLATRVEVEHRACSASFQRLTRLGPTGQ
jgi:replicative DNA helicase